MTKGDLQMAVRAYDANPTAAIFTHGPIGEWDVSAITNMSGLFRELKNFNADISSWDTSSVTNMSSMFYGAVAFNQPLSFNTSKVTDMSDMFYDARAFNRPLSFDTSKVTDMTGMFYGAVAFNQPLSFDTSKVTDMSYMFYGASAFNQSLDFVTSNVTDISGMFWVESAAEPVPLALLVQNLLWDLVQAAVRVIDSKGGLNNASELRASTDEANGILEQAVQAMKLEHPWSKEFFLGFLRRSEFWNKSDIFLASALENNQEIDAARTAHEVKEFGRLVKQLNAKGVIFNTKASLRTAVKEFNENTSEATKTYGPIADWDVSAIIDMSDLFRELTNFNADISSWDTSSVTNMSRMFYSAVAFNQPLSFDTSKVTDMSGMFSGAVAFNRPLSFDTSSVRNMSYMFSGAVAFNQPLSFNTSKVTDMSYMFSVARAFNQPLSFDTSKVTNMSHTFQDASAFNQPLSFDTSSVRQPRVFMAMEWKWPAEHNVDCKDYHPRIGEGREEVGGWARDGRYKLMNACDRSSDFMFHSENFYGVNGDDYVDFIFTFDKTTSTWCSGYRQFGVDSSAHGTPTFTLDIEIYTRDEESGPWTRVATDRHSDWHNGATNTFPNDGTTTEWTPTAPSQSLRVRTRTNHGGTMADRRLTVRFLQLKFADDETR